MTDLQSVLDGLTVLRKFLFTVDEGGVSQAVAAAVVPIATAIISLLGGLFSGKKAKQGAEARAGSATLQKLLPIMMALIQQQQQKSAQNFGLQQQQFQANLPMQDALRQMAMSLLPRSATQGLALGPPLSRPGPIPLQTGALPPPVLPPLGGTAIPRPPAPTPRVRTR